MKRITKLGSSLLAIALAGVFLGGCQTGSASEWASAIGYISGVIAEQDEQTRQLTETFQSSVKAGAESAVRARRIGLSY